MTFFFLFRKNSKQSSIFLAIESKHSIGNMELLTRCSSCSELYEEKGDHIPRILPCHNTVCEGCIRKLLKAGSSLKCPYCDNETHEAPRGKKSFSENKYILAYLINNVGKFDNCKEHDREMSMFCKDTACEKPICSLCLIQNHNQHHICDIVQEQEDLAGDISTETESSSLRLQAYKKNVGSLQKEMRYKFSDLQNEIEEQRAKINELYNNLIKAANHQMEKQTHDLAKRADNADKNVAVLKEIQENVTRDTNYHDLRRKHERVVDIDEKLSEFVPCKYFVFMADASNLMTHLQNQMIKKEVPRLLSYINCRGLKFILNISCTFSNWESSCCWPKGESFPHGQKNLCEYLFYLYFLFCCSARRFRYEISLHLPHGSY